MTSKSTRILVILKLVLAAVFWGSSFVATKIALQEAAPLTVIWLRLALGVGVLGLAAMRGERGLRLPVRDLSYLALLGLQGITFHQWLQSTGLVTAQASTTAWLVATAPIFIAILGWIFLKERLGAAGVAGIALAAAGVLLVVTGGDLGRLAEGRFGAPGDLLVLISAPNWAIFSVLSRYGLRRLPATRMVFYVMAFGWLFTSVQFLAGPGLADIGHLTLRGWLAVAFLGIFCSGLAYIFWYDGLQAIPASQAGVFLYVEPLVTVLVSAALLGEALLPAALAGGAVILLGVWLVNRAAAQPAGVMRSPDRAG